MSNICFILGAGASKKAGAPLMADFLDRAEDLLRRERIPKEARKSFEAVLAARSSLQMVHSKCELDILNVESVFAAFEMAKTLRTFLNYDSEAIEQLEPAMRDVIIHTLEETVAFPIKEGRVEPPSPYRQFVELVAELRGEGNRPEARGVAVITFNYDLAADFAFSWKSVPITYSLKQEEIPSEAVPVLKLHGSLNWSQCHKCNEVEALELPDYFKLAGWAIEEADVAKLRVGSQIHHYFEHCGMGHSGHKATIVPPTWNKTQYHATLSNVWSRAAAELSGAENIFVIGYSLPDTDSFFRYLYALGTAGQSTIKRFWVFNPDASVEKRFRDLLGPGARERFQFFREPFDLAINRIRNELPKLVY